MSCELSVICAFSNAAAYLPDLLNSLARTRLDDAEILFVDDASSDGSAEVIGMFESRIGAPVQVIRTDRQVGPAAGRNRGMEQAAGRYFAFVDGDDWVGPTYFAEMIDAARRHDVQFLRTDHVRCFANDRRITRAPDPRYHRRLVPADAVLPADRSTMVDFPYSHSGLFHRSLYDDGLLAMPDHLRTAEDRPWIWRLHLEAESYARIESLQYFYRRDVRTSLTQVGDDRQLDFIPSFEAVIGYVTSRPEFEPYVEKAVRQCLAVVHHHFLNAERLHAGLLEEMSERTRRLLALLPERQLADALEALAPQRSDRLRDIDPRLHAL